MLKMAVDVDGVLTGSLVAGAQTFVFLLQPHGSHHE